MLRPMRVPSLLAVIGIAAAAAAPSPPHTEPARATRPGETVRDVDEQELGAGERGERAHVLEDRAIGR